MSVTSLQKAILSMDAYNRGYNEGIKLQEGSQVVNAYLGKFKITQQSDYLADSDGVDIGFYAIAYEYQGEVIVTYRGLDEDFPFTKDRDNGFGVGGEIADTEQSRMAIEFYQAVVKAKNGTPAEGDFAPYYNAANISLTGHSMGGGLAGLALH